MKQNSRALLFSLYHTELRQEDTGFREYQYFYSLFPQLSEGGIRSLLRQLVSLQLVLKKTLGNQSLFKITETGRLWVEEYYQCLKSVSSPNRAGFLVILRIGEFKNTPQLYQLKKVLSKYPHQVVSSQIWWFPRLNQEMRMMLVQQYSQLVFCLEVKQWLIGQIERHNNFSFIEAETTKLFSETSDQSKRVLDGFLLKKRLTEKNKRNLQQVLNNLLQILEKNKASSIFNKDEKRRVDQVVNERFYLGLFHSQSNLQTG